MTARLVVLASGNGSNLQAVLDATLDGRLDARVVLVASNRADAYALERVRLANIPVHIAPYKHSEGSREAYDESLAAALKRAEPDLVVLAGWMRIFTPRFLNAFPGKVINLHPALPGAFPGTNAIARAFEAHSAGKINSSGCMVHYVVPEVDAGPVVAQMQVPFLPGDTLSDFEARMHIAEHTILPIAIAICLPKVTAAGQELSSSKLPAQVERF